MSQYLRRLGPVLIACLLPPLAASQPPQGTKWRVTTAMNGMGMNMPGRTTEVCATGEHQEAPAPTSQDKNCTFTQLERTATKAKFAMQCSGAEPVQGSGEITYSPNGYQGNFHMKMSEGEMSMTVKGEKLGACDGKEPNLAAQKAAAQVKVPDFSKQLAQSCLDSAKSGASPAPFIDAFNTGTVQCAEPAAKQAYCSAFQSYKPFLEQRETEQRNGSYFASNPSAPRTGLTPFSDSLKLCGLSADTVQNNLCAKAEGDNELDFLLNQCGAQSQSLAARVCAGRSYTTISSRYRQFCMNYARANNTPLTPAQDVAQTAKDAAKDTLQDKAKQALKGLFGR